MATLTGKIADVTGRAPDSISSITVKAPSARIGGGSDIIVTSPAKATLNKTTGSITISGLHAGLSWLYIEGDGWSDSIPLAVAEGFQLILEAVANASGVPSVNDYLAMIRSSGEHAQLLARAAVEGEFGVVVRLTQAAATTAERAATSADARATVAESSAGNAVDRVTALEAMSGLSPESPVDGQTANLVEQPDTLTRGAVANLSAGVTKDVLKYISPDGLTDHTTLIQQAMDSLNSTGGGTLSLLPGTYMISSTLVVPRNVSVTGAGQQSTAIDSTGIPAGNMAIHIPVGTGAKLAHFKLLGHPDRNTDGIGIGRVNNSTTGAVTDFIVDSVRVEQFSIGFIARYSWCINFINVRAHICLTGAQFGPQVNAITFNGSITGFAERAFVLNNAEGVIFNLPNVDSTVADPSLAAISLFQSQLVMVQPYIENIATLAQLGGTNESPGTPSSLVMTNGRISGTILLAGKGVQLTATSPWLKHSGTGTPFAIDVVGGNLGRQPRAISVDSMQEAPGIATVLGWDSRLDEWDFPNAYGGAGVSAVKNSDYHTATSPTAAQGIRIGDLTVGKQYVLSYRARKVTGSLLLREGSRDTYRVSKVENADHDFQVVHTPFIARDTTLRMLWEGDLDLQWISLTEGLHFLDRG